MDWKFEPSNGFYRYDEYQGVCGYSIMPYENRNIDASGYAIYLRNSWRTEQPLGEYININAELSSIFSEPSMGLPKDLIFSTVEEAKAAAEKHQAKGEEPTSYKDEDEEEK